MRLLLGVLVGAAGAVGCGMMDAPTAPARPCRLYQLAVVDSYPLVRQSNHDTTWVMYNRIPTRCVA